VLGLISAVPLERTPQLYKLQKVRVYFFFGKYLSPHTETLFFKEGKKRQPFEKTNIIVQVAVLCNKLCAVYNKLCIKKCNFSVMLDISQ